MSNYKSISNLLASCRINKRTVTSRPQLPVSDMNRYAKPQAIPTASLF